MANLQKIYREDLLSENINTVGLYINDEWTYHKENLNVPKLEKIANYAVVIGNGQSSRQFDLSLFLPTRQTSAWGERSQWEIKKQTKSFYTYGCNATYRDHRPDFLIATGDGFIKEIAESDYCANNVVYTNLKYLEQYLNKFNFIPQNPEFNSGAIAAYLAAFDGHKKIYLLGFDGIDNLIDNYIFYADTNNYPSRSTPMSEEFWVRSLDTVMKTYSDTEFVRVTPTKLFRQPEAWKYNLNYRQIDFRQFVLEADV